MVFAMQGGGSRVPHMYLFWKMIFWKVTRMRKMICELCDLDLYYGPLCMLSENSNHRICLIRAQYSIVSATTKYAVQWKRRGENVLIFFRLFQPYHKYKYHPKQTLTFFIPTSQHVIQFYSSRLRKPRLPQLIQYSCLKDQVPFLAP